MQILEEINLLYIQHNTSFSYIHLNLLFYLVFYFMRYVNSSIMCANYVLFTIFVFYLCGNNVSG